MSDAVALLFEAIARGDVATVRSILADDPSRAGARDARGVSAVLQARYHRQDMALHALLAARPALDVFEAAALGDLERLGAALDEDPARVGAFSPDGFTPLHLAAYFGQRATTALLLDRGADPQAASTNDARLQPLHSAAASGRCDLVALLLEREAPPDGQQQGGFTALHAAVKRGDMEMVGLLMDHGADPALKDDEGHDAVSYAGADSRLRFLLGRP